MKNKKRIVVTGLGVVSCFGNDVNTFFQNLLDGISGMKMITQFPCDHLPTKFAAYIENFDVGSYVERKQARRIDTFIAYSLVSGKKALEDAGLLGENLDRLNKKKCGILIGSGMGGMNTFRDGINIVRDKGLRRLTPFFIPYIITNMGSGMLAMDVGFMGPNYSISTACATGNYAIISAANHIAKGEADLMICGGVEAPISDIGVAGFCACRALSQRNEEPTKASRPWDVDRDGFVMGEGAGVLVLESLEHAQKRGAKIYAEYLGGGISCDAYHLTEPRKDGEGVAECVRLALQDAGLSQEQVDYINAHGTSTPAGDMAEVNALKKVFSNPEKIKMNSTKSLIGHALGAAGGLEAVTTVKTIETGKIHPTLNLDNPEPDLCFDVRKEMIEQEVNVGISNSFGFGGHNATVVFGKYR